MELAARAEPRGASGASGLIELPRAREALERNFLIRRISGFLCLTNHGGLPKRTSAPLRRGFLFFVFSRVSNFIQTARADNKRPHEHPRRRHRPCRPNPTRRRLQPALKQAQCPLAYMQSGGYCPPITRPHGIEFTDRTKIERPGVRLKE
jgi:hypothetical protein